jgi:two-component system chemotaxis sensor kinase CheA
MNDGLLAIEQQRVTGPEKEETLGNLFRAAHSLKGAARAVGVNAIEQLAHALEDILGALQHDRLAPSPEMFTACYKAVDAIQATQGAYEQGETTPPTQSLQALVALEEFRSQAKKESTRSVSTTQPTQDQTRPANKQFEKDFPIQPKEVEGDPAEDLAEYIKSKGKQINNRNVSPSLEHHVKPAVSSEPVQAPAIIETEQPSPAQSAPAQPANVNVDETIRVSVTKLDALMAQLSELLISKIHSQQRLKQLREVQDLMSAWQKEWVGVRSSYNQFTRHRVNALVDTKEEYWYSTFRQNGFEHLLNYIATSQERMREMSALIDKLYREYSSDTLQMALVIDGLDDEIKRVRMLPLQTITGTFARMVRDLAQSYNKKAILEITGDEIELDKRILEQIKDPLIHLIRNAVDHGIETPEKRLELGKSETGKITLSVEYSGNDVSISVADDGAGLNLDAIRKAAIRRNIPNAALMTEPELVELIYHTGFSSTPIITDVSGRGIGMDVVRRNIENLHGQIDLVWTPEQGSRFILTMPASLTSSRALLVNVSDQSFAIPLSTIERILQIYPSEIVRVGGHDTMQFDGKPLMLAHLGDVLGLPRSTRKYDVNGRIPVVVLFAGERRMAFFVDELTSEQEVVIKSLGRQLTRVGGIAGASVMGNGEITLILQVSDIIKLALHTNNRSVLEPVNPEGTDFSVQPRAQHRILVVDDSITTRTLEKNILEAAGYTVNLANDGMEAIHTVYGSDLPDLIISDIAMPRLDGFELTKRLKNDERTNHVPIILVTSLDSSEDKARGIEAGADAYIVKSNFDQTNLLETIEQLI